MHKKILAGLVVLSMSGVALANETSRVFLARADQQLRSAEQLVEKAKQADSTEREVTFNYQGLEADITEVRKGIQDYLNDVRVSPNTIQMIKANYNENRG